MITNTSSTKTKITTAATPYLSTTLSATIPTIEHSQTKLFIVPIYALLSDPDTYPELIEKVLENFKSKFKDKNQYVFTLDYRKDAEFKIIDLNTNKIDSYFDHWYSPTQIKERRDYFKVADPVYPYPEVWCSTVKESKK